ncbi:MAG TPA: hypothetical protein VI072_31600 [Polyangiaceae bacterium]
MLPTRHLSRLLVHGAAALLLTASSRADEARASERAEPTPARAPACTAWEVDYRVDGKLRLSETPLDAANGTYDIGPGAMTLRFENDRGRPSGKVALLAYRMRESYRVKMRALFTNTMLATDAQTRIAPEGCAVAAEGALVDTTVRWQSAVAGYRTIGSVTCTGFLCGKPGVPAEGKSELVIEPASVRLQELVLGKGLKTLSMDFAFVAEVRKPKQAVELALRGSELRRRCVTPPVCE